MECIVTGLHLKAEITAGKRPDGTDAAAKIKGEMLVSSTTGGKDEIVRYSGDPNADGLAGLLKSARFDEIKLRVDASMGDFDGRRFFSVKALACLPVEAARVSKSA